ncbi:MAG TPA: hypothetical protein VGM23_14495 [Armatimonadota bacterium]|jgi:hypothetical protein
MMHVRHYVLLALALAGLSLGLLGCSSSGSSTPSGTVTINTPAARLLVNSWGMFTAKTTGLTDSTVSWAMEPPGFGAVTHVRDSQWIANNLVLIKMPHTAGTHTLIATSSQTSSVTASIPVTIVNAWTPATAFDNYNSGASTGLAPTSTTTFTLAGPTNIVKIAVFHTSATLPTGTVTLSDGATTYGPYQTTPMFEVVNEGTPTEDYQIDPTEWDVLLNLTLPAGTYTISSSTPATWKNNADSGFKGMATVTSAT